MLTSLTTRLGLPAIERRGLGFVGLGLVLGAGLIASGQEIVRLQGEVSLLAAVLPFSYAFAAGMVATVNPCGVLLLPSLVAYHLGRLAGRADGALPVGPRARWALRLGLMATVGFVALFSVVGLIIGVGGRAIVTIFPVGGLVVGAVLAGLGVWLALADRGLGVLAAGRLVRHVQLDDDLRSPFLFGIAYAVASLGCTLPVFLVVAGAALTAGGPVAALTHFVSYALGMGSVLTIITLVAAFCQGAITRSLRRLAPTIHGLAASLLLGAGLYVANYWLMGGLLAR